MGSYVSIVIWAVMGVLSYGQLCEHRHMGSYVSIVIWAVIRASLSRISGINYFYLHKNIPSATVFEDNSSLKNIRLLDSSGRDK